MQTEAEKHLIFLVQKILKSFSLKGWQPKMINLGAAKSTVVEDSIVDRGAFVCDRCDIQECFVDKPYVGSSFICALEDMSPIADGSYDIAFANFVLEHVDNPEKAAREINRILKPGGELVLSLSNPQAPEFRLAGLTPTSFHQLFRAEGRDEAYPVKYAYKNISNLLLLMSRAGLFPKEEKRFPATYSYLYRFPLINLFSFVYDSLLNKFNARYFMGHVVLYFSKVREK